MPSPRRPRKRRKLTAEINVVPYIDVMLVLLIIFMVTAPLMNLGVDIQLPQSNAAVLKHDNEPVLVSVDLDGGLFLTLGTGEREAVDADTLVTKVSAFMRQNPEVAVLIGGDERVDYGRIYHVMALMQSAGATKMGLMSRPVDDGASR